MAADELNKQKEALKACNEVSHGLYQLKIPSSLCTGRKVLRLIFPEVVRPIKGINQLFQGITDLVFILAIAVLI